MAIAGYVGYQLFNWNKRFATGVKGLIFLIGFTLTFLLILANSELFVKILYLIE
jgi:hypothetical protein